jgi:hypothetical protein
MVQKRLMRYQFQDVITLEEPNVIIDDAYATEKLCKLHKDKIRLVPIVKGHKSYTIIEVLNVESNTWSSSVICFRQFMFKYTNNYDFVFYQKHNGKIYYYDYRFKYRVMKFFISSYLDN